MTHIICRASTCLFWEQGVCGMEEIEYEPDNGCLTFEDIGDLELAVADGEGLDWDDSDAELFDEDDDDDDDDDWEEEDDDWEDWEDRV